MEENDKKEKNSLLRTIDDGLLTYSSTKLGLTDYDKEKTYDQEERKLKPKDFLVMGGIMLGIIAVATVLVLFVLT